MTVIELKERLIEKIKDLDDESKLEYISWMIGLDEDLYSISDEEVVAN